MGACSWRNRRARKPGRYVAGMRVGVLVVPADPWPEFSRRVQRLEAMGYDHVWTSDHLTWRRYRDRPWFGSTPFLAGVAATTERIRFGPLVASPSFRHPVAYAKEVVTLDQMSGGRLMLGIGAGGPGFDATVLGNGQPTLAERFDRYREFVTLLDRLLREPLVSADGEYYSASEARREPPCVQQPRVPFVLAAEGSRALELVAQHGDAWVTLTNGPDAVASRVAKLNEACERSERDPRTLDRLLLSANEVERPLASVGAFEDFVGHYAELGFTDIAFHYPRADDDIFTDDEAIIEQIAADVLPGLLPSSG
jgi:alkanesulfonate monooxygenase SsuD/methylene tetrahydromethanopterin reductase-like flavin-dependent oxidoreductase (luciferase family)